MPPMPKHLTKGKYFDQLDRIHSDPENKPAILKKLREGMPIEELDGIEAAGGASGGQHVKRDWLGKGRSGPFGSTGWWRNWRGDPENTLRCAAIRALEISMGLTHFCPCHSPSGLPSPEPPASADPAYAKPHHEQLPIDYHWICGPSRFEAYVNWNPHQVTVVLITPGFDEPLKEYDPDDLATLDEWALSQEVGAIFIGQDELVDIDDPSIEKTITIMKSGVVTHHLDISRGGSGGPYPEDSP